MMRWYVPILTSLLTLCACAVEPTTSVQPSPSPVACQVPFPGIAKLKARGVQTIEIPEPGELVRLYNEAPPASNIKPERVYLLRKGRDDPGLVVLVIGECIVGHFPITEEVIAALERGGA